MEKSFVLFQIVKIIFFKFGIGIQAYRLSFVRKSTEMFVSNSKFIFKIVSKSDKLYGTT
jgi:hypothetical protein